MTLSHFLYLILGILVGHAHAIFIWYGKHKKGKSKISIKLPFGETALESCEKGISFEFYQIKNGKKEVIGNFLYGGEEIGWSYIGVDLAPYEDQSINSLYYWDDEEKKFVYKSRISDGWTVDK